MSAAPPTTGATPLRVLHLEDSALDAELIGEYLGRDRPALEIDRVWSRDAFEQALAEKSYDLILADHQLPAFDGETALEIAHARVPEVPFIFVSGTLGEDIAVEALKRGATDYVVKQRLHRLPDVVDRALREAAERTERRRAAEALRRSEDNFATLVDAMPMLCSMADASGAVTWFNRRWFDYTGLPESGDIEADRQGVIDPAVLPEFHRRRRRMLETGDQFEMVVPIRGRDGRYRPFLTRGAPVRNARGEIERWLGTFTDVSAQQEAEEQLKRLNETLEQRIVDAIAGREAVLAQLADMQKLETIGQLTGGVAHDFNNLLTPIVGNLDLLRQRAGDDPRAVRLIDSAQQAADRAKTLVQRLLAFARRQALEPQAVDVAALVDGMEDLIQRTLGPELAVVFAVPEGLPPARVDPGQLELALLNLAVNARDAMSGGGTLTFTAMVEQVGPGHPQPLRHGAYVRICVGDDGCGMDEETLKRCIEPFFSTKGIGKGTGLGLSMVHGLAAQSGGTLLLMSQPAVGTQAEIWLPVADAPAVRIEGLSSQTPQATRAATILLVDDEELVRAGTADMLASLGHRVVQARSGNEALGLVDSRPDVDLMITDYLMPGMNGADLAAEASRRRPGLPILLATGYANLAGGQMPNLPLLAKPFRQAELAARLARLLGPVAAI